jgi:hypothetical protein
MDWMAALARWASRLNIRHFIGEGGTRQNVEEEEEEEEAEGMKKKTELTRSSWN